MIVIVDTCLHRPIMLSAHDVKLYSSFTRSLCDIQAVSDRLATWQENGNYTVVQKRLPVMPRITGS